MSRHDVDLVVVGGGHNGLVCALTAARAGLRTVLFERAEASGGAAARRLLESGRNVPGILPDAGGFRQHLVRELSLEDWGVVFEDRRPLELPGEEAGTLIPEIRDAPGKDARAAYEGWRRFVERVSPALLQILDAAPPELSVGWEALRRLAGPGLRLRRLGRQDLYELLRIGPMPVGDWLGDHLPDSLAAPLALPALMSTSFGPRAAGTGLACLLEEATSQRRVVGGPAELVEALTAEFSDAGGTVVLGCEVAKIQCEGGRARGVRLASGETVAARAVAGAIDPRRLFLRLVPAGTLPMGFENRIVRWRQSGHVAAVLFDFGGDVPGFRFRKVEGGLDGLERVADAVRRGRLAETAAMMGTVYANGTARVLVAGVPYAAAADSPEPIRKAVEAAARRALEELRPDLSGNVPTAEVLLPTDLERELGIDGGHLWHGDHALDQMLSLRPDTEASASATPVAGLYLAASGAHPGGGFTGVPGWLAARRIATDLG